MSFYRVYRRIAAWLAMLAVVLSALAPTLAHAWVAASDEGQLIEVCSASGMVWLKVGGSDAGDQGTEPSSPMVDMAQHCPWCSFHVTSAGLPPTVAVSMALPAAAHTVPAWVEVISLGEAKRAASARGPPLAS